MTNKIKLVLLVWFVWERELKIYQTETKKTERLVGVVTVRRADGQTDKARSTRLVMLIRNISKLRTEIIIPFGNTGYTSVLRKIYVSADCPNLKTSYH